MNFSDVATYNLVNNKVEKTKLKSDGEFIEKTNKFYSEKKITMPNVKVGSIIEYKYIKKSPFLSKIDEWYFQDFIPINHSTYQFTYPEYFTYNPFLKGELIVKNTKRIEERTLTFTNKERVEKNYVVQTSFSESKLTYNENIVNYEINNVMPIKDESYVRNIANYVSSVSHELVSIQYPNEPFKLLSTSWDEVAKTINSTDTFGGELNKKGYFEEEINKIVNGVTSNEQKIISIFNYVKQNFKWNGYYGIYTDEGVKNAFLNNFLFD